jgi:uncharacterized repeat protein (TIGR03803 family)
MLRNYNWKVFMLILTACLHIRFLLRMIHSGKELLPRAIPLNAPYQETCMSRKMNFATLCPRILAILFVTVMVTSAWASLPEKLLISFNGASGNEPAGMSMDAEGNLWVVTLQGGTGTCNDSAPLTGCGAVFEFTPTGSGWNTKVVYSFRGGADGWGPIGSLAFDAAGNVYGVTLQGGSTHCGYGCGVVYKLAPQSSGRYQESVIYRFDSGHVTTDGYLPYGGLVIDASGNLYGTTYHGGSKPCSCGAVFEVSPTSGGGWSESVLHSFGGWVSEDGAGPYLESLALDAAGNLYGTTSAGGTGDCGGGLGGCGTVFELSPSSGGTWNENILYTFQGGPHDGQEPYAGIVFDGAGNIYGTTFEAGSTQFCTGAGTTGCGVVFELSAADGGGWTESIIHTFTNHGAANPSNGLVFGTNGSLYGVTSFGGQFDAGTAFELTPSTGGLWSESILHSFGNGTDGSQPITSLMFDAAGNLYGATQLGGSHITGACDFNYPGCGTVFELKP